MSDQTHALKNKWKEQRGYSFQNILLNQKWLKDLKDGQNSSLTILIHNFIKKEYFSLK